MTTSFGPSPDTELAIRAGEAAAAVLPSLTPLAAVGAQVGSEHVTAAFAGASTAQVVTAASIPHRIGILVGRDLVQALKESPISGLDVASATQPAIDAIAEVLDVTARAGVATDLSLVVSDLGGPFTVVPLIGEGIDAAVLIPDSLLVSDAAADASVTAAGTVLTEESVSAAPPVPAQSPAPAADPLAAPIAEPSYDAAPPASPAPVAPAPVAQAPVAQAPVAQAPIAQAPIAQAPVMQAPVTQTPNVISTPVNSIPQQFTSATSEIFAGSSVPPSQRGIEMLAGVDMEVTVELGRTRMPVRDLLALSPGTVLELDRAADGPADLLVNGRLIARGEVVVVDEDFGLRITEIIEDAGA